MRKVAVSLLSKAKSDSNETVKRPRITTKHFLDEIESVRNVRYPKGKNIGFM